jgi:uncharacterized protein (DUF1015 family)
MPHIKPFRALLYNAIKVQLADVVAPPYDIITPEQQSELHQRSPQNIVRLILDFDAGGYAASAQTFAEWKKQRILIRDAHPAFYVLSQRYRSHDGKTVDRKGFIAACKLEESGEGSVFPHEKTHRDAKDDRLNLFKATDSMFSQILAMYSDPRSILDSLLEAVRRSIPFAEVEYEGVTNRLWALRDKTLIHTVTEFMKRQKIYLADGHHRYASALAYRDYMRKNTASPTGNEPFNYLPVYFTNLHGNGLAVRATHRLVHGRTGFDQLSLMHELETNFHVIPDLTKEQMLEQLHAKGKGAFGVVFPQPPHYFLIWRKESNVQAGTSQQDKAANLDASILHEEIFSKILKMTDEQQEQKRHLVLEQDEDVIFDAMAAGKYQAAFLMNPPDIEALRLAAESNRLLPPDSTYFYPKLLSGLVNYSFVEE